jgi:hypothetical protein
MPDMNALRIASLAAALCLGLMLGLTFGGATHAGATVLVAFGAGLMLAVCALAEWRNSWKR